MKRSTNQFDTTVQIESVGGPTFQTNEDAGGATSHSSGPFDGN